MTDDTQLVTVRVRNRRSQAYHTQPDSCQSVGDDTDTEQVTVTEAQRRGLELCRWCDSDNEVETSDYDRSFLEAAENTDADEVTL